MKDKYFEEIDGLRFYVFLLILINHTGIWNKSQGHTFFFMLSGFLISYSSYNDIKKHGTFSLKRYFYRRILRTFPLYFLIILFCGFCYLILKRFGILITLNNYWSYFFFVQNYFVGDSLFVLKNLWAMAVTEQLYFCWGLLIFLLQKKILQWVVPLIFVFTSIAFATEFTNWSIYESSLTYAGIYLLGVYSGLLLHKQDRLYRLVSGFNKIQSSVLFAITLLLVWRSFLIPADFFVLREYCLAFSFCSCLILLCYAPLHIGALLTNKLVKYLGKISYGLYCYHALVLTAATQLFAAKQITYTPIQLFILCLFVTVAIAILSYEFYEKKFLEMKRSLR